MKKKILPMLRDIWITKKDGFVAVAVFSISDTSYLNALVCVIIMQVARGEYLNPDYDLFITNQVVFGAYSKPSSEWKLNKQQCSGWANSNCGRCIKVLMPNDTYWLSAALSQRAVLW